MNRTIIFSQPSPYAESGKEEMVVRYSHEDAMVSVVGVVDEQGYEVPKDAIGAEEWKRIFAACESDLLSSQKAVKV